MRTAPLLALALALTLPDAARAQDAPAGSLPDLSALLECRLGYEDFMAFMPVLLDPLKAVSLGWRPQPQTNPYMLEYRLNTPVTVFGRQSDHIRGGAEFEARRSEARNSKYGADA